MEERRATIQRCPGGHEDDEERPARPSPPAAGTAPAPARAPDPDPSRPAPGPRPATRRPAPPRRPIFGKRICNCGGAVTVRVTRGFNGESRQ